MIRRLFVFGAVFALLVGAIAPTAGARTPKPDTKSDIQRLDFNARQADKELLASRQKGNVKVIVTLAGESLAEQLVSAKGQGKSLSKAERAKIVRDLKADQAPTITRAKGLGAKVRETFQATYNGFSVSIPRSKIAQLRGLPGVVAVHAVRTVELDNERSVPYIGTPAAWDDLGLTGDGVKIGIIDTGIDYYHANLGGAGNPADFAADDGTIIEPGTFPTAKVAGGYDFVGDAYDADTPVPDPDPIDCNGHGSHVGGTAAGNGVLADGSAYSGPYNAATIGSNSWNIGPGVAPQATLYAYRVFGCDGSANDDVILAAIEMATLDDEVDVINMSLGSPFSQGTDPLAVASNAASAFGTTVVASSGNAGASAYITGGPSVGDSVLAVAAMDGGFPTVPTAVFSPDTASVGTMANNNNSSALPVNSQNVRVLQSSPGVISLGCSAADYAGVVAGEIVVTLRGVCARIDRAILGQAAGASAVIMINSSSGLPPFEGPIAGVTIPFLGAAGNKGPALLGLDGTNQTIVAGSPMASPSYKHLASFTSGGPREGDSALKPDVTAPGVSTVSTGVGTGSQPATLSGTSMASPHTAGVAALVTEAHPSWSPEAIKAAIVGTATASTSVLQNTPPSSAEANIRLAGAGLVQPRKAVDTQLYATTGAGTASLSFGAPALLSAYGGNGSITFHNTGSSAVKLNLSGSFQSSLGATIGMPNSVNVAAGGTSTVNVQLKLSATDVKNLPDAEVSIFGALVTIRGAITATPTTSGPGIYPLRIPFLVAPRGLSDIEPSVSTVNFGTDSSADLMLENTGKHSGFADFYALGGTSPDDSLGAGDIHAFGVQSLPTEFCGVDADPDDRCLIFAVNDYGSWSNPGIVEHDVYIDTDFDDNPEFLVIGFDFGAINAAAFDGRYASWILDLSNGFTDAWVAIAPMNSSSVLLPALAAFDLGIDADSPSFQYAVVTWNVYDGTLFDATDFGQFNAYDTPVSTGDYIPIDGGHTANASLSINRTSLGDTPVDGWLIQTMNDALGAGQADVVNFTYTP